MRLSLLWEKLNNKCGSNLKPLTTYEVTNLDRIKVIGITGSKGKSTTAYLLHKYMEKLNITHQIYCSIKDGSNKKNINKNISVDIPLKNENKILDILEELREYPVEYLILEISERTIDNHIIDDIDFELKVLTNILTKHNKLEYDEETYINLKLSFLKNSKNNVLGLTEDVTKEMIDIVSQQNENKPIIYSTRFYALKKGVEEQNIKYLLYDFAYNLEGFRFNVLQNKKPYIYQTNLLLKHNALNLTCLIAIIDTLGIYNQMVLYKMLKNVQVLAREHAFKLNNKLVLVGTSLVPVLEELRTMQQESIIKGQIVVLTGSPGLGFVKWKTNAYELEERKQSRNFAMNYVKKYADKVYITEADSAATSFNDIAKELTSLLGNEVICVVEENRNLAIKKAILEAGENDVIYIAGRGNRALLYDNAKKARYFNDIDAVKEIIERGELEWDV